MSLNKIYKKNFKNPLFKILIICLLISFIFYLVRIAKKSEGFNSNTTTPNYLDLNKYCPFWASKPRNYCQHNLYSHYMIKNCKLSCDVNKSFDFIIVVNDSNLNLKKIQNDELNDLVSMT